MYIYDNTHGCIYDTTHKRQMSCHELCFNIACLQIDLKNIPWEFVIRQHVLPVIFLQNMTLFRDQEVLLGELIVQLQANHLPLGEHARLLHPHFLSHISLALTDPPDTNC